MSMSGDPSRSLSICLLSHPWNTAWWDVSEQPEGWQPPFLTKQIASIISEYVPTPEHEREEAMPSDLGERKEVVPQEPASDFLEEFEEPQLLGSLLRQHEATGRMTKL